ncbi:MAG: hypothetical protein AMXMBFR46_24560 [Acidimicrobiia bacterium]
MRKCTMILSAVLLAGLLAACSGGGDDGADVRTIGDDSSASASGSATGSASGSRSASATGTGSATVRCEPVGNLATATTRVNVTLTEWSIKPAAPSAPAGQVGFVTENVGEEPHELVIVKGVAPSALPTDKHGSLVEDDLPSGALIGEIEAFPAGETCDGVFSLTPGDYTLVCNITEKEPDGEIESHLAEGMVTTFAVT